MRSVSFQLLKITYFCISAATGFFAAMAVAAEMVSRGQAQALVERSQLAKIVALVFLLLCIFISPSLDEAVKKFYSRLKWARKIGDGKDFIVLGE